MKFWCIFYYSHHKELNSIGNYYNKAPLLEVKGFGGVELVSFSAGVAAAENWVERRRTLMLPFGPCREIDVLYDHRCICVHVYLE